MPDARTPFRPDAPHPHEGRPAGRTGSTERREGRPGGRARRGSAARRRLAGLGVLALAACGDDPAAPPAVAVVRLAPAEAELELGDSVRLELTVEDGSGVPLADRAVAWTSSNPDAVHVRPNGTAVGLAGGTATVRATVEGVTAAAELTVHPWNVADDVVVVDSTVLRLVSDAGERQAGTLRFEVLQAPAPTIAAGQVVVGAQDGGFLRRVVTAAPAGGQLTLETDPAALADVVAAGGFTASVDLFFAAGVPAGALGAAARARPGRVVWGEGRFSDMAPGMIAGAAGFDLGGMDLCEVLKDASDGAASCPDRIKKLDITTGSLDFGPELEIEADIAGFSLERFRGAATGSLALDLELDMEVEGELASWKHDVEFFTYTRPFYAQIGPLPVVGYAEMTLGGELSAKATAKAAMEAGLEASGSVTLGAEWEGSWEPVAENSGSFAPHEPSVAEGTLSGDITVEAGVSMKPRLQLILYGVVGPFAEIEPFGKATLAFGTSACNLKTETGINAAIGFTVPFLDDDVQDFEKTWEPAVDGPGTDWTCPLGALDVSTVTNGQNPDPDGYTILVDEKVKDALGPTDQRTIGFVEVGERTVTLDDVATNCTVQGDATRTVTVAIAGVHSVPFLVECTALTGTIEVSTATSGAAPDPDGYAVALDGGSARPIGNDDTLLFEEVAAGAHTVVLSGLAPNCSVSGASSVLVTVAVGATTALAFDVACGGAELTVRTSTSGPPASSSGWVVRLDGGMPRAMSPNGQTTYETTPGDHAVSLDGLPSNCSVNGANPADVSVAGPTEHIFEVQCQSAGIMVSVTTEGDADPATGYTVVAGGQSLAVPLDGSVSFAELPQGTVQVELTGLPSHCLVEGLNPRSVSVPGSTSFQVTCQQIAECPANPPVAELFEEIGHSDGDGGGTWETEVLAKDWGNLEAFATSTAPGEPGFIGPGVTVELGWFDHVSFVPLDPERVGELAELVLDVSGYIEVAGGGNVEGIDVHTFVRFYSSYDEVDIERRDEEGLGTFPFSQQATLPVHLGKWDAFYGYLVVNVGPGDASTSESSARLRIDRLVEVRDLDGNVIPLVQVCTASGHEYPM